MQVFRKVNVSERLPSKSGDYFVFKEFAIEVKDTEYFNGVSFPSAKTTDWLEAIELPSYAEIKQEALLEGVYHTRFSKGYERGFNACATWILDKIFK